MKSVKTEYFKRVESGNVFQAINICGVPTVRYEAGIIQWAKEELQQMNKKTRKLITIYGGRHPRSCLDRRYRLQVIQEEVWQVSRTVSRRKNAIYQSMHHRVRRP